MHASVIMKIYHVVNIFFAEIAMLNACIKNMEPFVYTYMYIPLSADIEANTWSLIWEEHSFFIHFQNRITINHFLLGQALIVVQTFYIDIRGIRNNKEGLYKTLCNSACKLTQLYTCD